MLVGTALLTVNAQEKPLPSASPWPQDVEAGGATIMVYQPQPETFEGNRITGRAAVSVVTKGETEPKFGAIWLEARVSSDRDSGIVELLELKIPRVRFPNATEENQKKLVALLEKEMVKWAPTIDLDRLTTSLDSANVQKREAKNLKTDPPKIVFVTEPTELVILQGKAALRPVENSTCMRVINTNFFLVLDAGSKQYFLNLGKVWFKLGLAYVLQEKHADSAKHFEKFIEKFPASKYKAAAMYWAGHASLKSRDTRKAYQMFMRCVWDFPESKWARWARGSASSTVRATRR